jgi:hypothetical protein
VIYTRLCLGSFIASHKGNKKCDGVARFKCRYRFQVLSKTGSLVAIRLGLGVREGLGPKTKETAVFADLKLEA